MLSVKKKPIVTALCLLLIVLPSTKNVFTTLKQYVAGECVDLLDGYDFPARTITETEHKTSSSGEHCFE